MPPRYLRGGEILEGALISKRKINVRSAQRDGKRIFRDGSQRKKKVKHEKRSGSDKGQLGRGTKKKVYKKGEVQ